MAVGVLATLASLGMLGYPSGEAGEWLGIIILVAAGVLLERIVHIWHRYSHRLHRHTD